MPRVLPGPAAELNAAQKKRENEKNRENADANFTSPRRKYCTAQERLRDHSPKKDETRFDSFQPFVFETLLRLIALRLTDSRMGCENTAGVSSTGLRLRRERVDHSMDSSPCALDHTVRHVLSGNRRTFRHVPRRADRPSLNAANANA